MLTSPCYVKGMTEKKRMFGNRGVFSHPSGAFVFKVSLFNTSAKGQQVAVALDSLCQLCARESGGQNGEEVAKYQSVQFCRPVTHMHSAFIAVEFL